MNEVDALLDSIDEILTGPLPTHAIIDQIRGVVYKARRKGNVDDSVTSAMLSETHPDARQQTDANGILSALEDAINRARSANSPADSPRSGSRQSESTSPSLSTVVAHGPRETAFQRCFPLYTKYFTYQTQKLGLLRRSKPSFTTCISPDTLHFVTCSKAGEYIIYSLPSDLDDGPTPKYQGQLPHSPHFFLACNNDWVVISSALGSVSVISFKSGKRLWQYEAKFGTRALSISPTGAYIALGITTKKDGEPQPIVLLICPDCSAEETRSFLHVAELPFVCPYKDPVRSISFSPDELQLLCSTDRESRYFIVSLLDPKEPRLLLRSNRHIPHDDPTYEGITSVNYFPRRSSIVVTSMAKNSPPIIVDARLNHLDGNGLQTLPSLSSNSSRSISNVQLRADKVGSKIHGCAVSPRENAVAFLDQCGLVYVMFWPKKIEHHKKCAVVFELAGASSVYEAASLQFSQDGTVLYAVDRKACLHIADFGAGMPQSAGISSLRVLS